MKNIYYMLFIIILFLSSCITQYDIKGTWVGLYVNLKNDSLDVVMNYAEPNVLTFKNNKCYSKSSQNGYGSTIKISNLIIDDTIVFKTKKTEVEKYKIIKVKNDSLVLNHDDRSKKHGLFIEKFYRKLPNNLKHNQKIDLVGKKFILKHDTLLDTLLFTTDSTYERTSFKKLNTLEKKLVFDLTWERINFEGFDFIFITGTFPILIISQEGKTIKLLDYSKSNFEHSLTEIK